MFDASKDLIRGLGETLGKKYPSGTHPVLQCFGKVGFVNAFHLNLIVHFLRWLKSVKR